MRAIPLLIVLAACRGEPADTPAAPNGSASAPAAVVVPADAQDLKHHMRIHFAAISELQRAIARGHLEEAKQLAGWLGSHDEPTPPEWQSFVDELHTSARAVEKASDLPTAASLAARLGRACSKCHETHDAIVTFAWEPPPDESAALASQMKRHQWAAARLWDGLVGPSDSLWEEGSKVLSTTQLDTVKASNGVVRGDVPALAARVRELALRATKLTDHDERAELYGQLLSTCAGCHVLVRPAPVPGP
jgi:hypothetical protein